MDVLQQLKEQHGEIKGQIEKIASLHGGARRDAVLYLRQIMAAHEKFEEEILHPMARDKLPDGGKVVGARVEEERAEKQMLSKLEELMSDVDSGEFDRTLKELRTRVHKHIAAEEHEEFQKLFRVMTEDPAVAQRLHKLGEQAHDKHATAGGECPHSAQCPRAEEEKARDVETTAR